MFPRPELSLSLAGLSPDPAAPWSAGPRAAIEWASRTGFHAVQLDAAAAGVRPRELDRSARRDLAALLRRAQLALSGLDLWIPPEHLVNPAKSERAMEAIVQAVDLAADLARLLDHGERAVVSLVLPAGLPDEARRQLGGHAESRGTRLADHAAPASPAPATGPIGIGVDPAAVLLAGQDPAATAARAGSALAAARLSDATMIGRTAPLVAPGRLDLTAYLASVAVAGYTRPLVLDVRGLPEQASVARAVRERWG
jgi:sugar phosphate isomerase/epimerase